MRQIHVKSIKTKEIVHSVDVTDQSERDVERVMRGMLINMSDDFFITDSLDDEIKCER